VASPRIGGEAALVSPFIVVFWIDSIVRRLNGRVEGYLAVFNVAEGRRG
jgi:hypothetical protein